ncbi:aminoacyl-histidine dipeptidase [Parabacteroides sp. FAFU027]|uniref:aminoacyl-histidine dipeptidase n=1 Tax=Parabacteroides sp. FAFU027 TaxID=2922715 RepID=UPI001FAE9FE0|nr:aminoacyl-histidine dipeptidase [Parabacteroides sp. FAFU027]
MKVNELAPQPLWSIFETISHIPHPSHHLEQITSYVVDFGKKLGLETVVDETGNVVIKKPATPGMENRKKVVLQAHLDMVPQKNASVNHDFTKDSLQLIVEGDWVKANNTTLGSDNGIGVASILAVLQATNLKHGPIEALLTADEETGMYGAFGLKPGFIEGEILINTDSEEEGELFVGCAGGMDMTATFQYKDVSEIPEGDIAFKLSLTGLKGGHSGVDIHLGRYNANKLLFRFLKTAVAEYEAHLSWVSGGTLRNAIPREAFAIVTIPNQLKDEFLDLAAEFEGIFKDENGATEPNLAFKAEETDLPKTLLPEEIQDDLINAIVGVRNGVARMNPGLPGVVESSSNLAIVETESGKTTVNILIRSSLETMKEALASSLESVFLLAGAKVEFSGDYPGWAPNPDSPILKTMKSVYLNLYGKEPTINVIHAGLECGIIGAVYPGMDMISFGPTLKFPHSPDEKVNIPSVERYWNYLVAVLENIPVK